jgi:uncharacterized protein (DUF433 family)
MANAHSEEIVMSPNGDNLAVPLRTDSSGVIRIGETRVSLDTVIGAFRRGATPEEIVQDYSSLKLADVYATIAYYLQNRPIIDAYLHDQRRKGEEIRHQMEAAFDPTGIRERLLARRKETA